MEGYERAAGLLPGGIRQAYGRMPWEIRCRTEEIHLRLGEKPSVQVLGREQEIPACEAVSRGDLLRLLELATGASPYAAGEAVRQGYVTAEGGLRVGLCGKVRPGSQGVWALSGLSSAVIRIPREVVGCAEGLCSAPFVSTLILSPPGGGKTTLLRDMVRQLSEQGIRIGLCDERDEVAALSPDGPGFAIGRCTDVLSELSKDRAVLQLIRTMSPHIIAMDEISATEDRDACRGAFGCGVRLLATVHGESREDLLRRPGWAELLGEGRFSRLVLIRSHRGKREYREEWL